MNGEGPRDGWFFPGLKSAPTIVLCPAYGSSRGELLTLASALQDQQYNVLVFDFSAHGSTGGRSTLGLQEVAELRAAIDAVANRGDVDANRFGLWGVNLGAYVALSEATSDHRVRAIAVESPYVHPNDMVAVQVSRAGLGSLPWSLDLSQIDFWLAQSSIPECAAIERANRKAFGRRRSSISNRRTSRCWPRRPRSCSGSLRRRTNSSSCSMEIMRECWTTKSAITKTAS